CAARVSGGCATATSRSLRFPATMPGHSASPSIAMAMFGTPTSVDLSACCPPGMRMRGSQCGGFEVPMSPAANVEAARWCELRNWSTRNLACRQHRQLGHRADGQYDAHADDQQADGDLYADQPDAGQPVEHLFAHLRGNNADHHQRCCEAETEHDDCDQAEQ